MKNLNCDISYTDKGVIILNIVTEDGRTLEMTITGVQRDLLLGIDIPEI